jgi:integrase
MAIAHWEFPGYLSGASIDGVAYGGVWSEAVLIQNKRVNWDTHQIGIPGATAKDRENRRIPFNPKGRLAAILERRKALGPDAYVFGTAAGEYQPELQTAWETLRLLAYDVEPRATRKGAEWNREQLRKIDLRWHDLRHEGACRLLADGVDIRIDSTDARSREHHADAAVPEHHGRGTQERTGGELEQQRPTASTRIGSLKQSA